MKASLEKQDLAGLQFTNAMTQSCVEPSHSVHLYECDTELTLVIAEYLSAGVLAGEVVVGFVVP